MEVNSIVKVLTLFIVFHVYVFLSGLIYHVLERNSKSTSPSNVEQVLDKHFYHVGTVISPSSKASVVTELRTALQKDKQNEMQTEFGSLWKAYLFSLTSVVTVGNSGLFLQSFKSQLFFIFSTMFGTLIFVVLLHHIGVILLEVLVKTIQYGFFMRYVDTKHKIFNPYHARIWVLLLSYITTLSSVILIPLAGIVSGHGYLFGMYAVVDTLLTIGNFHILAYVHPWSEGGYVVSVNIMIILCYSFLYTTIFTTIQVIGGARWEDFVAKYGAEVTYKQLSQEEEEPYQKFLNDTKIRKNNDSGEQGKMGDIQSVIDKLPPNPFLEEESNLNEEQPDESVVPTLLSPEREEFVADNK